MWIDLIIDLMWLENETNYLNNYNEFFKSKEPSKLNHFQDILRG